MQIENGISIEANLRCLIDQQINRRFVIQDHLCFFGTLADSGLAQLQQPLGFQQRVGVALQAAGVPSQIDHQPREDLSHIGARR